METTKVQRWIVEYQQFDGSWGKLNGRWIFEAAVVKAREWAINKGTTTRLVRAR